MDGMGLHELQTNWHKFGQTDPLWAIVSRPTMKGNKWNVDEFLATGQDEVKKLLADIEQLNLPLPTGQALDFGCGIGRVTQPLCDHFDICHGVDIAPSMIEMAIAYNRYRERCFYYINETSDLSIFADNSINFILSLITLQNVAPRYSEIYLKEFLRILAPGGLVVFQIPSEPKRLRQKIKQKLPQTMLNLFYRLKYKDRPVMELHGVHRDKVIQLLEAHQGKVLHIVEDKRAFDEWTSFHYYITK
ncbi:class I SAM-dependent methyltransferase [Anaerolineales bacterium HSG25]|nr:class I SAM-dependent methyltransferase [Anaerolineales bacterium HSG25]